MNVMIKGLFDAPVYAASGRCLVEEIGCVDDALDYMETRTFDDNDVIAEVTSQALRRCLDGQLPVSAARETFFRMLKKKGLLVEPETALNSGYVPRSASPNQGNGSGCGKPQSM